MHLLADAPPRLLGAVRITLAAVAVFVPATDAPLSAQIEPARQGVLNVGRSEVRDLNRSAEHAWIVTPAAGEYVELTVQQRGSDVEVRIFAPDGGLRYTFDDVKPGRATEAPKWIANMQGEWTVVIAHAGRPTDGAYTITWTTQRNATAADGELVAADSLARMGRELTRLARFTEADSLLLRSLGIRERVAGADNLEVAASLNDLAVVDVRLGRVRNAETRALKALEIREAKLGAEHLAVAATLNILGVAQYRQARYAEAEATYRRALAINEKLLGRDDITVAGNLNNLAQLLGERERAPEADTLFRRSLAITESVLGSDDPDVARTLQNIAWLYTQQSRFGEAEPLYRRALDIRERVLGAEHMDVAWNLYGLGWNQHQQGQHVQAEQLYRRSIQIWEARVGMDHPALGSVVQNLAILFVDQGRYADAEVLHRRSLGILEKSHGPEHPEVAGSLNDIGVLYFHQGRYAESEAAYRRALAIRMKVSGPRHSTVGMLLGNIALLYNNQGRYAEAEPLYQRALEIAEQAQGTGNRNFANNLNNIGLLYSNQGRHAEAEPVIERALALTESLLGREHPQIAVTLRNLGNLYVKQSRYVDADTAYRRALAIEETAHGPESLGAAGTLAMLGMNYTYQQRYEQAEPLLRRALDLTERNVGPDDPRMVGTLTDLAGTLWKRGNDRPEARTLVDRALDIIGRHPVHPATQIEALTLRARMRREAGDTTQALSDLSAAIEAAEERRPQIGGGEETRAAFFTRYAFAYELMVGWQIAAGDIGRAFEFAERGRARVLLDQLAAGKIDLRASIPTDVREPLVARETAARARMAEYQQRMNRLRSRRDLTESERMLQAEQLQDSLNAAEREFRIVYEEIKNASPLWRDLLTSGGQPITLSTVQRRIVPDDGFLLLYQIGEEQSFLFLVAAGSGTPEALPLRIRAEEARSLGVDPGALTARALNRVLQGDDESGADRRGDGTALASVLGQSPARGIGRARERASRERLHALWRVLVPDTVWKRIERAPQVVIIPGRGLHVLPFEALVTVPSAGAAETRYWLDDGPALRYGASASMIYNLENRATTRLVPAGAGTTILSLSDPAFGSVAAAAPAMAQTDDAYAGAALADVTRSSFVAVGGSLARLPGTAAETEAIRQAFSGSTFSVLALQGADATESRLRPALSGMRYVHLATHGIVDEQRGALFAALALTPPPVMGIEDDGFLQLHEIYRLRLPEVELAVLSACETNVGSTIEGEGVFALSRGFFAAGARRVVASQWVVDDRSTAEIVGQFFGEVAADESSGRVVDYVSALRDAKRAVRQNAEWAHPYFWAPFVLTGAH